MVSRLGPERLRSRHDRSTLHRLPGRRTRARLRRGCRGAPSAPVVATRSDARSRRPAVGRRPCDVGVPRRRVGVLAVREPAGVGAALGVLAVRAAARRALRERRVHRPRVTHGQLERRSSPRSIVDDLTRGRAAAPSTMARRPRRPPTSARRPLSRSTGSGARRRELDQSVFPSRPRRRSRHRASRGPGHHTSHRAPGPSSDVAGSSSASSSALEQAQCTPTCRMPIQRGRRLDDHGRPLDRVDARSSMTRPGPRFSTHSARRITPPARRRSSCPQRSARVRRASASSSVSRSVMAMFRWYRSDTTGQPRSGTPRSPAVLQTVHHHSERRRTRVPHPQGPAGRPRGDPGRPQRAQLPAGREAPRPGRTPGHRRGPRRLRGRVLRPRLLLGRRGDLLAAPGRLVDVGRVRRRHHPAPVVRRGVLGPHQPHRGRPDRLRPDARCPSPTW